MNIKIGIFILFIIELSSISGYPYSENSLEADEGVIDLSRLAKSIYGEPDEAAGRFKLLGVKL